MNTDNYLINKADLEQAKTVCKYIENPELRELSVACAFGAKIASSFFDKNGYNFDTESGLHNIDFIVSEHNIADIYVNGIYIDVRVIFNENDMLLPASHFKNNLLPFAYMFIKVSEDMDNADVLGFVLPESIPVQNYNSQYIKINESDLKSFYEIKGLLIEDDNYNEVSEKQIYDFLDNKDTNQTEIIKNLLKSRESRLLLLNAYKTQMVFNYISKTVDLSEIATNNIQDSPELELDSAENLEIVQESTDENIENNYDVEALIFSNDSDNANTESISKQYSTVTTPSLDIDAELDEVSIEEETVDIIETDDNSQENEELNEGQLTEEDLADLPESEENQSEVSQFNDSINTLYERGENANSADLSKGKRSFVLPLLLMVMLIGGGVYYAYTKFFTSSSNEVADNNYTQPVENEVKEPVENKVAMPVETITETEVVQEADIASSETINTIEKNLDASILVSNLKVDWEVPSGYASNTSAKRYLLKLGKIIQFNLKTDLLLLSKPPISNMITVEIQYNSGIGKFETVGIKQSSGEKEVDNVILNVINNALSLNLNMNTDSFKNINAHPVIIIKL